LENPPLVVVSDMERIEVRTNFTNAKTALRVVTLDDLERAPGEALDVLHGVMHDPEELHPGKTPERVTEEAAERFAAIAASMGEREDDPGAVAHFLNRVLFCLFAENVGLLPKGMLKGMIESRQSDPRQFARGLAQLFQLMSERSEDRYFGNVFVRWFNGGLFDGGEALAFTRDELQVLHEVALLDWSQMEPSILGTLFERALNPDMRGQLGAHYTDQAKILLVVEPVVLTPLRREFAAMRARVEELMAGRRRAPLTQDQRRRARLPAWERRAEAEWRAFLERLRAVHVLDPACGSGNFLYVALRLLKDLEHEVIEWGGQQLGVTGEFSRMGPENVLGIEVDPYAKELAGVSIWIGQFQWMLKHGIVFPEHPVLEPLDNVELRDAILRYDSGGNPIRSEWLNAEFIVGNPPFLGNKRLRRVLGDEYVDHLFGAWDGRVSREADLVTYWHEKAREMIAQRRARRAGLLATNRIRGSAGRQTMNRIKETGDIFMAWSDEPWVVEGAAVHVSIVGQDDGSEEERWLDGKPVDAINSNLSTGVDVAQAGSLAENHGACFMGDTKVGAFDIRGEVARQMLALPSNVNGRSNSDVVVPWVNGADITGRPRGMFIIDFGTEMTEVEAADYEAPFAHVDEYVRPQRENVREARTRARWWLHQRPRPEMRAALAARPRFIATPRVAKHRLFVWLEPPTLADSRLIVTAREDDYTFGVLHSRAHEWWSLRAGSSHVDRPFYTPTTTFETFPFPWPLDTPEA
ncbi:MAG: class I SAM-dependent DNA methyltransferase, partial [Gemmatimonadota bacterium]|nr:class I SAM-dependent DNA methyltransferase [Gemmatimonadota bacterium]